MLLQTMVRSGRVEAGVYLLGLMDYYADDQERLKVVVEALGAFHCPQAVSVLVSEFYRIESSNQTRGYRFQRDLHRDAPNCRADAERLVAAECDARMAHERVEQLSQFGQVEHEAARCFAACEFLGFFEEPRVCRGERKGLVHWQRAQRPTPPAPFPFEGDHHLARARSLAANVVRQNHGNLRRRAISRPAQARPRCRLRLTDRFAPYRAAQATALPCRFLWAELSGIAGSGVQWQRSARR